MSHLLDTDHLTLLAQQDGREWASIVAHINTHGQENVAASVVSFHEQILGCHNQLNQARKPAQLVRWYQLMSDLLEMYAALPLVPFDDSAATMLAGLPRSIRIGTMDLRIAAIALSRNLVVVTRNVRDFGQVPGLRIEDWTQ
ncbi:tRNA(fMet)-specific endonuclease VapC [Gemmata sp. SH-PL17]|uniref:type II toxin-antitoxin system VapC family toxin n=1 Tax=Gemmata sp. SH-PL17 TaxID=1630693 RepID=UPI000695C4B2|nr:type II toxin-antitoxin system VapC family toxin [Gemmata sp. SH-PL17]AMV30226.1 tRNA(fMet)-specific endonuclease VapC [Gemmata sp. SH-PL17]